MKRRDFITLGGAAMAWPLAARAQQPTMPVVGFLHANQRMPSAYQIDAIRRGLSESGYVEGQNVAIEYRWADGHYDRLPDLAADLVRRKVTVIATAGGPVVARVAKAAIASIPIVFVSGDDPVRHGLVASFNRPGEMSRVQCSSASAWRSNEWSSCTNSFPMQALPVIWSTRAIPKPSGKHAMRRRLPLAVATDPFLFTWRERLVATANRQRIPMITHAREYVAAGALASYGASIADAVRQAGIYVGRILKGEKPADLPDCMIGTGLPTLPDGESR